MFSLVLLMIATSSLSAQKNNTKKDIIYLKNGSIIKGHIIKYDPNKKIEIEIDGGSTLVYPSSDVLKIEEVGSRYAPNNLSKSPHKPNSPHLYHSISGETFLTLEPSGPGLGLNTTSGWHFHRLFGIGIGAGINNLGSNLFIPIYTNIKGYFMKSSASLFYNVDIGYGIGINLYGFSGSSMKDFRGGFYTRPSLGIRLPSTRKTHLFMDLGCMIQNWHIEFSNAPAFDQLLYNLSLRIGLSF